MLILQNYNHRSLRYRIGKLTAAQFTERWMLSLQDTGTKVQTGYLENLSNTRLRIFRHLLVSCPLQARVALVSRITKLRQPRAVPKTILVGAKRARATPTLDIYLRPSDTAALLLFTVKFLLRICANTYTMYSSLTKVPSSWD